MSAPVPTTDPKRIPWLPTDGNPSPKHYFLIFFGFFLCVLLSIAHWSWTKNAENIGSKQRFRWHFLGGKSYNSTLMFFTLFSIIFSAVTIAGVPYESSVTGFFALRWLTAGSWVVLSAIILQPRGYRVLSLREHDSSNDFITDRFNNRALSMLTMLLGAASIFVFMITQFFAISTLIPTFSKSCSDGEGLDRFVTTWILGVVIIICEWIGGYDAVTWTDMIQSIVLIGAFIAIPSSYAYYYGSLAGVADSFEYDCANFNVINCSQQAFIDYGSPCSIPSPTNPDPANFRMGCMSYANSRLTLHPTTTDNAHYFLPLTRVAEGKVLQQAAGFWQSPTVTPQLGALQNELVQAATQAGLGNASGAAYHNGVAAAIVSGLEANYPKAGPYDKERAMAPPSVSFNRALGDNQYAYLGTDAASSTYSRTPWNMLSFNLLFFSLPLNPHWAMKSMSSKTDHELKTAQMGLCFSTVWSTFPMLLVGITGGVLLRDIHPNTGTDFFGTILDDMQNKGGFTEFLGAVGAVGAIAAMMSTVDSALIAFTNIVATEVFRNWLFPIFGVGKDSDDLLLKFCKAISLVTLASVIAISLYEPKLQDDVDVYSTLIEWQSSLLWQLLPGIMLGLYFNVNAFACIAGQICGVALITGLYLHKDSTEQWSTGYTYESDSWDASEPLSSSNHPEPVEFYTYTVDLHVWAAITNIAVSVILSIVAKSLKLPDTIRLLSMDHVTRFGDDKLTLEKIEEIMDVPGTREPVKDPIAIICLISTALLTTFGLPWWGDVYDNCDYNSFARWVAAKSAGTESAYIEQCASANMSAFMPNQPNGCPLEGGYFTTGTTYIPTEPAANIYFGALTPTGPNGTLAGALNFANDDGTIRNMGNGKVCEGYDMMNGIPRWAMTTIICWILSMFLNCIAWSRWGCIDDKKQKHARGSIVMNSVDNDNFVANVKQVTNF